jgi:outer membrane receptor protein involved in Fe transport
MANLRLTKYFNLQTNVYFEGARERIEGDLREDPEGFAVVDLTLIARKFIEGLELRMSVYNVLDTEYTIATPAGTLPVDFPMAGRNFLVEASYNF